MLEGATVSGCRVANGKLSISKGVLGAIVGVNYGTVENCVSYGMTLSGPTGHVGGIVGDYNGGELISCYTTYSSLGSVASGYVGAAIASEAGVSNERIASGEIAYTMNSYIGDPSFWYQSVGNGGPLGKSEYNVVGKIVYGCDFGATVLYSNKSGIFKLTKNFVITDGKTLTIPTGITLEIASDVILTNNGTLVKNGELTGSGKLNGTGRFIITEINASVIPKISDFVYDGKNYLGDVTATLNNAFITLGKAFTPEGYEFYKSSSEIKNVGSYEIGYVLGEERYTIRFSILPVTVKDGDLSLNATEFLYNGTAREPEIILNGYSVMLGRDYTLSFTDNTAAGAASVTVIFRGNFIGEFTRDFTIKPVVITETVVVNVPASVEFTGSALDVVSLTVDGVSLRSDVDYTLTYSDNVYPGTATVVVVGKGSVSGEATYTFEITRPVFTVTVFDQIFPYSENINVKDFDQTKYEGTGLVPGHTVVLGERIVSGGTDEEITVLGILDANGVDVLEYYEINILAKGKYHMFYESYRYDNDGYHWRECVYNCDEITDYGKHIGDPATCVDHSMCDLCGTYYEFATGIHTWVDSKCTVCGMESYYEVWVDTDGNGQFNGEETGNSSLVMVLAYGNGSYKLLRDVSDPVYGVGNKGQRLVIDLYGRTFTITNQLVLQAEDAIITFIDTSPNKTGRLVGNLDIRIFEDAKIILDGVNLEGKVSISAGTLELKNGATILSYSSNGGSIQLYEGYDFSKLTINTSYSTGGYETSIFVGDLELVHNADTGALECSDNHVWADADCITAKHCSVCGKTDGDPLGHDTNGPASCEEDEYCSRCETVVAEATGHKVEILDSVAPTCDSVGYTQGSHCANGCGAVYVQQTEIPALGHTVSEAILENEVKATCTSDGSYDVVVYCSVCDEELSRVSETVPALGHNETASVLNQSIPGCTYGGWTQYLHTCQICGDTRTSVEYLGANGHTAGEPQVEAQSNPTCTVEGYILTVTRCSICSDILESTEESIPTVAHVPNIPETTCIDSKYCVKCGCTIEGAKGHTYTETLIEATCYGYGGIEYFCTVCETGYFDITSDPTGHTPNMESPTCDVDKVCVSCGFVYDFATGHTYVWATCSEPTYCSVCETVFDSALGHMYNYDDGPTCTVDQYCYRCSYVNATALGHEPDKEAPTCEESVNCTRCSIAIEMATGHTNETVYGSSATCTEDGVSDGIKCSVCDVVILAQTAIPAYGHSETTYAGTPADCSSSGLSEYTVCLVCDTVTVPSEIIPALGHTEEILYGAPASCTDSGLTDGSKCSVCGTVITEQNEIPALGHTCDAEITAPDCVNVGYTTYTCSVCGDSYEDDVVAALGHSYDTVVTSPDCVNGGYTTYTCLVCGDSYTDDVVAALGHSYDAVVTAPGCFNIGCTTYTCVVCGDSYADSITDAVGHIYETVVTSPDCVNGGYTTYTCSVCGDSYVDNMVGALGHTYETVVTSPDCVNGGYTTYTCSVCGDSYVDNTVGSLGHTYETIIGKDATCTESGLTEGKMCSICGDIIVKQEMISAIGHKYEASETKPTCTDAGYTTYSCTACDYSYTADDVDALGHEWLNATCDEPQTCSVCDATNGEALGHNWLDATIDAPKTCDRCGATDGDKLPEETPEEPENSEYPETPNEGEKDHSECLKEASGSKRFWNAIGNFFRRIFSKYAKCVCGDKVFKKEYTEFKKFFKQNK